MAVRIFKRKIQTMFESWVAQSKNILGKLTSKIHMMEVAYE